VSPVPAPDPRTDLLAGEVVLVTGAAGDGVGGGICAAVHDAGADLVLVDVDEAALHVVAERYPDALAITGDVSRPDHAARIFEEASAGVGLVTGLVNSAGIGCNRVFYEAGVEEFERLFAVDVRGPWLMAGEFARRLITVGRSGAIVNISSVHARSTMVGYAMYAGAKAAVEGLTRGMAVELGAHGVRCNAVAPGYVHAAQNFELLAPLLSDPARWAQRHTEVEQVLPVEITAEDVGASVVHLLSGASRSTTGQVLAIDAGLSARVYSRATFAEHQGNP